MPGRARSPWWSVRRRLIPELAQVADRTERRRLWRELRLEVAPLLPFTMIGVPLLVWLVIDGWSRIGGPPLPVGGAAAAVITSPFGYWLPLILRRGALRAFVRDQLAARGHDIRCMRCNHAIMGIAPVRCPECGWVVPRPVSLGRDRSI